VNIQKRLARLLKNLPANQELRFRALLLVSDYTFDAVCIAATKCETDDKMKAIDHLRMGLWNRLVSLITGYDVDDRERGAMFGPGGCHASS